MSLYSHFALLWAVPVSYFLCYHWFLSPWIHMALMWEIKLNKNITKDDRYYIYYFYCWLFFLMFQNLQLVWEIIVGAHMSCELLPSGRCVCCKSRACVSVYVSMCVCWSSLKPLFRGGSWKHHQIVTKQELLPSRPDREWGVGGGREKLGSQGISVWLEK